MKKRSGLIIALISLLPMGQPLLNGKGALFIGTTVILSVPDKLRAEDAAFYYNRGVVNSSAGDYEEALYFYNKAIKINPQFGPAYNNRGNIKEKISDFKGAISDYSIAIKLMPNDSRIYQTYENRSKVKMHLKDYQGAISDIEESLKINPTNQLGYALRGALKEMLGDMKGACSDMRKANSLGDNEDIAAYARIICSL